MGEVLYPERMRKALRGTMRSYVPQEALEGFDAAVSEANPAEMRDVLRKFSRLFKKSKKKHGILNRSGLKNPL